MRRGLIRIGFLMFAAVVASAAGVATAVAGSVDAPIAVNLPPRVDLTGPTDGFVGVLGCPVTFTAVAVDPDNEIMQLRLITTDDIPVIADNGIERVEFYLNGHLLATDSTAPYEVTVAQGPFVPATAGEKNTAFALAYDDDPPPGLPGDPDQCLQATPPA